MSDLADLCHAGISRLREQAQAAIRDGTNSIMPLRGVLAASAALVLALCDYLDQQTDAHEQTLTAHHEVGTHDGWCAQCDHMCPCSDHLAAEAGLSSLAALITTIEGTGQ